MTSENAAVAAATEHPIEPVSELVDEFIYLTVYRSEAGWVGAIVHHERPTIPVSIYGGTVERQLVRLRVKDILRTRP